MIIAINVGCLIGFKYLMFLLSNINGLIGVFGLKPIQTSFHSMIFPVGISYYMFSLIGYQVDLYNENEDAQMHLGKFAIWVLLFPKFISGPIERSAAFFNQITAELKPSNVAFEKGILLILWGLCKKVMIADRLGILIDFTYQHPGLNSKMYLLVYLLYPLQIYADFSGYTDMARGSASLFGINLLENFNVPFLSKSITEFWRRWHISLSSWVNEYIYRPVSMFIGLRWNLGRWGIALSLVISFSILGIWHGPNWTFLLFGTLQSVAITFEFFSNNWMKNALRWLPPSFKNSIFTLSTYLYYAFTCIFFRSADVKQATSYLKSVVRPSVSSAPISVLEIIKLTRAGEYAGFFNMGIASLGIFLLFFVNIKHKSDDIFSIIKQKPSIRRYMLYACIVAAVLIFGYFGNTDFIYVQF
ncbi:MAG: MBOAT family O-acyltransferase [Chitinophagales bacterium]